MNRVVLFKDFKKLGEALDNFDIESFSGKRYPLKLHMGEIGNKYYPKADFVKILVKELKERGGEPFLYDTTVFYKSIRRYKRGYEKVAKLHGFNSIGVDVVIDDTGEKVKVEGRDYEVGKHLYEATHVFALSHVKGHISAGFGGAIKNFGMGGVTKETKEMIHHGTRPVYNEEKCTYCGICAKVCPFNAIKVEDKKWIYNIKRCFGCGVCVENCRVGAIVHKEGSLSYLLACSAKACVGNKRAIYLNDVNRISKYCDCIPSSGPIVCKDVGYLLSNDIVAIDKASLDLINEIEKDIFKKLHNVDPENQVRYGEKIGLGCSEYELIEI